MPCDAIVFEGSCVVNESMLTGESIPVSKAKLPASATEIYEPILHYKNTIFSGTEVIHSKDLGKGCLALVVRTSFETTKGLLIKSILYPKPSKFSFYSDSLKFIGVMAILSVFGMLISIPFQLKH